MDNCKFCKKWNEKIIRVCDDCPVFDLDLIENDVKSLEKTFDFLQAKCIKLKVIPNVSMTFKLKITLAGDSLEIDYDVEIEKYHKKTVSIITKDLQETVKNSLYDLKKDLITCLEDEINYIDSDFEDIMELMED